MPNMALAPEVITVLRQAEVLEDRVVLPPGELDRKLYTCVDRVLTGLGGRWSKKARAHLFPHDPRPLLAEVLGTGLRRDLTAEARREHQDFFTPDALADRIVREAGIKPGDLVLEPSAGMGSIARAAARIVGYSNVVCVELRPECCEHLRQSGFQVCEGDFLQFQREASLPIAPALCIEQGEEVWRPVPRYEDIYEVSSWGRLRRLVFAKGYKAGSILEGGLRKDGYVNVMLCRHGKKVSHLVHQIVAEAFLGPCPDGMQVNHKHPDGNRSRNWSANLEYRTSKGNNADQRLHRPARYAIGEAVGNAKLTQELVVNIRRRLANGETQTAIAETLGLHSSTISALNNGLTWRQVLPLFNVIVANPPFRDGLALDHITHALTFLAPGGCLVSVLPDNVRWRQDATHAAFRATLAAYGSHDMVALPDATFKEAGTGVRTVLLRLHAPVHKQPQEAVCPVTEDGPATSYGYNQQGQGQLFGPGQGHRKRASARGSYGDLSPVEETLFGL